MAKYTEARICLNVTKPSNSAFYCPVNNLHITRVNPVGAIHRVTPMIVLKLKSSHPSLVDLDSRIDLEKGDFKDIPEDVLVAAQDAIDNGMLSNEDGVIVEEIGSDGKKKKKV